MMRKTIKIKFFILMLFFTVASIAQSMAITLDDGTDEGGTFIFPKKLAMFCNIGSKDVADNKVMGDCLNKVLDLGKGSTLGKEDINKVFKESYHQMNAAYSTLALQKKQAASAYDSEMDKILEGDKIAATTPSEPEVNTKKKQEVIARLGYMTGRNVIDIVDVYTARISLDVMSDFRTYEMSTNSAPLD